ncbi:MAG: PilC/PilY family type IV pilus protein [bacterium]|nr:PilC/PilY family type IV pilus protein [bacterium]
MKKTAPNPLFLGLISLILFMLFFTAPCSAAMDDHCVTPPFLSPNIAPNILIVLDNSGSMCGEAYSGDYDPTQFENQLYYGYFEGDKNYRYDGSRWVITTAAMYTGTVANPIAKGSFLNWATMRRVEASKKLLIGGKANPRSPNPSQTVKLEGETGCDRNFRKTWTTTSDLIYPFVGKYTFYRNNSNSLTITSTASTQYRILTPQADLASGSWTSSLSNEDFHVSLISRNYGYISNQKVDSENHEPAMVSSSVDSIAGTLPDGILTVTVYIRGKKNVDQTIGIGAALQIDEEIYLSDYKNLSKKNTTYGFSWEFNPHTNLPWKWDDIKKISASGKLQGFGVQSERNNYDTDSITVNEMYLQAEVSTPNGGPFRITVDQGQTKAQGIIDSLDNEVRFGLSYYNRLQGGRVSNYIGYKAPTDMITSIHNMVPSTWTPLGETLYEMVRYFRQDPPYYTSNNPADYTVAKGNFGSNTIFRDPYAYKFSDINAGIPDQYVPCAKSFILFLTDGESTEDRDIPFSRQGYRQTGDPYPTRFGGTRFGTTYSQNGRDYMIDIAYWARTEDMRPGSGTTTPTTWSQGLPGMQNIFLYPVYMFGSGSTMLKDAAIYGGFDDKPDNSGNRNNRPDCNENPSECYRDSNGDGVIKADGSDLPLTYYEGSDGYRLEQSIKEAIQAMLDRAASSTAVSVLSSSQGSGANIVQSLFYPKRTFGFASEVSWISDLMNYWYYLDPTLKNLQIREDTVRDSVDYSLFDLRNDRIVEFEFDAGLNKTMANLCLDADGNGVCDPLETKSRNPIEEAQALWRAGQSLWWTKADSRRIWTTINGSELTTFAASNSEALDDYMGLSADAAGGKAIIEYVRGKDQIDKITEKNCQVTGTSCSQDSDCNTDDENDICVAKKTTRLCSINRNPCTSDTDCAITGEVCEETRNRTVTQEICSVSKTPCSSAPTDTCGVDDGVCQRITETWKLGDVVSSTPRILGPSPLNNYDVKPPRGYSDKTYNAFVRRPEYAERGQVLVGANDGMLHAFKLGKIRQKWSGQQYHQVGIIEGTQGKDGVGSENWAYVPKNALPYLQYLSKPNYCHVYTVDGPVFLADVSIQASDGQTDYWNGAKTEESWRTVAIGSMGIGGATSGAADGSCVQIPLKVDGASVGWSAYFALDVTDQNNPSLLWEFPNTKSDDPDPGLGVSNIGPAIVKVGGQEKRCSDTNEVCSQNSQCGGTGAKCVPSNGRWFAILASGSTGPINTTEKSFQGTSNQNLKLFVLDLKTGTLVRTIDTGITNAFAGSMGSSAVDLEKNNLAHPGNYQDDVLYIGYVQNTTSGGVLRLVIDDDPDPTNWTVSKVIDNIGPVTTSVANLLDRRNGDLWLFFAEGRFFHPKDDHPSLRRLYGIKDPCYTRASGITQTCANFSTLSDLKDQSSNPARLPADRSGWYITMDKPTPLAGAERVISNPTPDPSGAVYFLSFMPTTDICGFGGTTYLWSVDYKSGMSVIYLRQGTALVQVSTGAIKELDLSDSKTFPNKDYRRSEGFFGIPPAGQGLVIVTTPLPVKEFMNVQEQ